MLLLWFLCCFAQLQQNLRLKISQQMFEQIEEYLCYTFAIAVRCHYTRHIYILLSNLDLCSFPWHLTSRIWRILYHNM